MTQITNILTKADIKALRANFNSDQDNALLIDGFTKRFCQTKEMMNGIEFTFRNPKAKPISLKRPEIVIITLLCSQKLKVDLSLHLYLGLMNGLAPYQIGEILSLVGVYSGVPAMALGLETAESTFSTLKSRTDCGKPLDAASIFAALAKPG